MEEEFMMQKSYQLEELQRESTFGGAGEETNDREIRIIDLSDFDNRRQEITQQLWEVATEIGFFQLSNHGIDSKDIGCLLLQSQIVFLNSQNRLRPNILGRKVLMLVGKVVVR
ncbi:2-oxoglutarate and iron-dependent oxygenase domain-containing protein [Psychromonas sp. KJ10-10]|uniref:2-oxoglutarate and iron-dependent oxygenase domain-containing protein n=1 Tax=Psychromonas sp. KJ10-10 TaxID=3391823 RepID=UPI0039B568C1